MPGITESLKPIIDKLTDFFHIFDLSYIISGIGTSASIYIWMFYNDYLPQLDLSTKQFILIAVLVSYIFGLVSFGLGRIIRKSTFKILKCQSHYEKVKEKLEIINIDNENDFDKQYWTKWSKLREDSQKSTSYNHINRYWVMTATYDGLISSFLISIILIATSFSLFDGWCIFILTELFFTISVYSMIYQADKNELYQKLEIFITVP
jgi:hypothetical protein